METPRDLPHRLGLAVVFFDGYCGLCSGVVDFLITRDVARSLRYSPLQGETARLRLSERERADLDTVVVMTADGHKLIKSDAILEALLIIGGFYAGMARLASLIPRPLRDFIYDVVARNRFRLFGRRNSCRLPSNDEQTLFLP